MRNIIARQKKRFIFVALHFYCYCIVFVFYESLDWSRRQPHDPELMPGGFPIKIFLIGFFDTAEDPDGN